MSLTKSRPYYNLMLTMKKKKVTQAELAKGIGLGRTTLNHKLLGNYSMKLEEAKAIAKFLNIDLNEVD